MIYNEFKPRKSCRDIFNASMLDGAKFSYGTDIPYIPKANIKNIENLELIPYTDINRCTNKSKYIVHFYVYDYLFDGKYGIWNSYQNTYKKGFNIDKLKGFAGVIAPDYSVYNDFPLPLIYYNIYRSRSVGYWFSTQNIPCIPNIRWSDERSFQFAFEGIEKGSIVSIGTLGLMKEKQNIELFEKGFDILIDKIHPSTIIVYGKVNEYIAKMAMEENIKLIIHNARIHTIWEAV